MKDPNKITALEVKHITSSFIRENTTVMWHGKKLIIRNLLTPREVLEFVNEVISNCTTINEDKPVAIPEMIDFVFRSQVVTAYSQVELPTDLGERYTIIYSSDLFKTIYDNINHEQIDSIKGILEYYTGLRI